MHRSLHRVIPIMGLLLRLSFSPSAAQPVIQYTAQITTGLTNPIDIANAGDGSNRLFVVQRNGTIRAYNASLGYIRDFLTVTGIGTAGEGGLLSLAFHPDYETNGYLYVYYTLPDLSLELARYHISANPDSVDAASRQVVLNIPHPVNSNHNGGKLLFGTDGYLYLGTGDGGGGGDVPNNAQNGNSLLGKMLRLNVTTTASGPFYTIPPTNPYVSDPNVLDEIWATGLRNPFRWSFDRSNGDMWIADVGQGAVEEINYRAAGSTGGINYGWRCYEGDSTYNTSGCQAAPSYTFPIFSYTHNNVTGGNSVTGGFVYRGPDYPALQGWYICADYGSGNQWTIQSNGAGGWNVFQQDAAGFPGNIVAYGEAENGALYAASISGNAVYKIGLSGVLPLSLISFTGDYRNGKVLLEWKTIAEKAFDRFEIEYSKDGGTTYAYAGTVKGSNSPAEKTYHYEHYHSFQGTLLYRLKMIDADSRYRYSNIIAISNRGAGNQVYPSLIGDGQLYLQLQETIDQVAITDLNGRIVFRQNMKGRSGNIALNIGQLAKGMYFVRLENPRDRTVHKIIVK